MSIKRVDLVPEITYRECDFSTVADDDPATVFLVVHDKLTEITFVDARAPKRYKELAAIHAGICRGKTHELWANQNFADRQPSRYIQAEAFVIAVLLETSVQQVEYIEQRIAMLDLLSQKDCGVFTTDVFNTPVEHCAEIKSFLKTMLSSVR